MMLFELPSFEHIDAKDAGEAASYLRQYGGKAKVIAGATDLLGLMKDRIEGPKLEMPEVLVNIKTIPAIARIDYDEMTGLRIGAGRHAEPIGDIRPDQAEVQHSIPGSSSSRDDTAQEYGNSGRQPLPETTMFVLQAGALPLLQKRRRQMLRRCRGTSLDHSIMEKGKCVMAHPSDMAPALMALKARAVIAGPEGERSLPLVDFFCRAE